MVLAPPRPSLHPHFPPLSTSASPLFLFVYSFASFTCISTLRNRRTVKLMGPPISSARSFSTGWDISCTQHQVLLEIAPTVKRDQIPTFMTEKHLFYFITS